MDLSGTMQAGDLQGAQAFQRAGGVGGLLLTTDYALLSTGEAHYPTYDANGNVSEYLDASGTIAAHYQYDAFGNTIVKTGTQADAFSHRFSTKPLDSETGLYYYGYRYYDPVTGRWPSRDPIEDERLLDEITNELSDEDKKIADFISMRLINDDMLSSIPEYLHERIRYRWEQRENLYGFVKNDPLSHWDEKGLFAQCAVPVVGLGIGITAVQAAAAAAGISACACLLDEGCRGEAYCLSRYTACSDWIQKQRGKRCCQDCFRSCRANNYTWPSDC